MCQRGGKQTYYLSSVDALVLLVLLFAPAHANAQSQAMVKRVTAETYDGVRFTAWIDQQTVSLKQNVTIFYKAENRSDKTIYLVQKEGEIRTVVDEEALSIPFLILFSGDSDDYHYSFTKLQRGKAHKGQLIIPASRFNKGQTWLVNVSFGFVTDINGLDRRLRRGEDPVPYREMLSTRIKLVGINGLVVEVEEP